MEQNDRVALRLTQIDRANLETLGAAIKASRTSDGASPWGNRVHFSEAARLALQVAADVVRAAGGLPR